MKPKESYPDLGESVAYARFSRSDDSDFDPAVGRQLVRGTGIVKAIHADPFGRRMVRIKDGNRELNVFLAMVNPSDETVEKYAAADTEVKRIEDEGNAKVKAIIDDYNQRVADAYTGLLGEPVIF